MRKLFTLIVFACLTLTACQQKKAETNSTETTINTDSSQLKFFGEKINMKGAIPAHEIKKKLNNTDSMNLKIEGKIVECCKKKGCWMTIDIGHNELMTVRFKDYGFFVPKNADGKTAIFEGVAKKEITDVATLKHYAQDAGKSQEEIDAIAESEMGYAFLAKGVIIKNEEQTDK